MLDSKSKTNWKLENNDKNKIAKNSNSSIGSIIDKEEVKDI
jgi:hypothetical protein